MAKALQPPPFKTPVYDSNGLMHPAWIAWIRAVQVLLNSTSTMAELEARIAALE